VGSPLAIDGGMVAKKRQRTPDTRKGDRHARPHFKARIDEATEDAFRQVASTLDRPLGECVAEALASWTKKNRPRGA